MRGQEDSTGEKVNLEEESGSRPDPVAPTAPPPSFRLYEKVALDEELGPQDEEDLDKKVARYHNPNFDNPQLFLAQENLKQDSPKIESNLEQPKTESKSPRPPSPSAYVPLAAQVREMKRKMAEMGIWNEDMLDKPSCRGLEGAVVAPVVVPAGQKWKRQPRLQTSIQQAYLQGEDVSGFMAYPVLERPDGQGGVVRDHAPMPFKQLKEIKTACAQYGPTAPFTLTLIDTLSTESMAPAEWKQLSRACLSGGDFLLWRSDFSELCQITADINRGQNIPIDYDMLTGEGPYRELNDQLNFNPAAYVQTSAAARRAWAKIPGNGGRQTEDLAKIRQGPDELYQDFVARLIQSASRLMGGENQAGMMLVKQLAFENANAACQAALRPFRKKANLNDYIRLCSDIGPFYTQGLAIAAAMQGKTIKEVLFQRQRRGKARVAGPPGSCFECGQMGHQLKQCPKRQAEVSQQGQQPGLCPRCKRGKHWASECKSKRDASGNSLMQGNWKRGQPQAPKQCYGALLNFVPEQGIKTGNPFKTLLEQPQAAQDWTSVPPPTQY
ncbi:PREDICTED: endogenous retrovirus group K member 5 Gag polyprotein-like [Hipposideros armiger]|uniref:Endogenous retrovirus group K member 5 Gag polyprotein-like n=1 Tax=Hipposideros armiger TaxID=186990 RepID=A0A8B7QPJ8_HIPAR|nr:PREDICTED: endogenous retrovirus group K member 5 Gag polyprotein-like [Hipposideros armiger]